MRRDMLKDEKRDTLKGVKMERKVEIKAGILAGRRWDGSQVMEQAPLAS